MAKERLSLYFDTDVPTEKKMWDYICKDGRNRKSYNVKKALELFLEGTEVPTPANNTETKEVVYEGEESNIIKTNMADDLEGEEDLPF